MSAKNRDENAKNPAWQVPMSMPGAKKGAYNITTDTNSGNEERHPEFAKNAPFGAGPADPAGKGLQKVTTAARKLAHQGGESE